MALLALDQVRVEIADDENRAAKAVDSLIRNAHITPQMATSLINDGAYVKEVIQRLLDMNEQLRRAELSYGDRAHDELALKADEIANIAKHAGSVHDKRQATRETQQADQQSE